jgi:hypothetical protein
MQLPTADIYGINIPIPILIALAGIASICITYEPTKGILIFGLELLGRDVDKKNLNDPIRKRQFRIIGVVLTLPGIIYVEYYHMCFINPLIALALIFICILLLCATHEPTARILTRSAIWIGMDPTNYFSNDPGRKRLVRLLGIVLALLGAIILFGFYHTCCINQPPVILNFAPNLSSPQILGATVTWTAEANDPESDSIFYRFLVNGTPATDWQVGKQFTWIATVAGTSRITAQVKDNQHDGPQGSNGNKSDNFIITASAPVVVPASPEIKPEVVPPVELNESPSIISLTADKESCAFLGTTVTWTAKASDPESDSIFYRFLVNGTPATDWQAGKQFTWTATVPGSSRITAQVKDNQHDGPQGASGNRSDNFIITASAPVVIPAPPEIKPEVVPPIELNESPSIIGLTADKEGSAPEGSDSVKSGKFTGASDGPEDVSILIDKRHPERGETVILTAKTPWAKEGSGEYQYEWFSDRETNRNLGNGKSIGHEFNIEGDHNITLKRGFRKTN